MTRHRIIVELMALQDGNSTPMQLPDWAIGAIVVACLIVLASIALLARYLNFWLQAMFSGAHIGHLEFVGMMLRKVDLADVVYSRIRAVKGGVTISVAQLETHWLAGGHVPETVTAILNAKQARLTLSWETAAGIDRKGYDVVAVVGYVIERSSRGPRLTPISLADAEEWRIRGRGPVADPTA